MVAFWDLEPAIYSRYSNHRRRDQVHPSTGVTLPLVTYGGSSSLSTLIMFAIIQGLYILREDEEEDIERKKRKHEQREKRTRE